jgi:hypothetical protein
MASPLVTLLQAPDRDALDALLADAARFHSPVADYEGRADVAHLLWLIASVVGDIRPTRELADGAATTTFFDAAVDGRALQGVLDERYDERGRLVEATLMLRPFATLRIAIAAMAAALEEEPLPSAR